MSARNAKKKTDKPETRKRSGLDQPDPDSDQGTSAAATGGQRKQTIVEQMTQAYGDKIRATQILRDPSKATNQPNATELEVVNLDLHYHAPTKKKPKQIAYTDKPLLSLKTLVPDQIAQHVKVDDTIFRAEKVEFVLLEQPTADDDAEWEIPDQETFDLMIMTALDAFSDERPDIIHALAHSSTGWNTGVGLLVFHTADMQLVEEFRTFLKDLPNPEKDDYRYITIPKMLILNKYSLSVYFGPNFAPLRTQKLMLWIGLCNNLVGNYDVLSCRTYPRDHPNEKRRGARIVTFEGDQDFYDSLHQFPRDFPFTVKVGGNVYIRGGDRADPDDPRAIQGYRPRIKRSGVRQLMSGVKEKLMDQAQDQEDQLNRPAFDKQKKWSLLQKAAFFAAITKYL